MTVEFRFCELRSEGERVISGTAIRYGDIATLPWGKERFEAGAFDVRDADIILNSQHDRKTPLARTGGGGLEVRDSSTALEIRAELPRTRAADDVLELVRAKVLRGLSIEFHELDGRMVDGVRVVSRASLSAVGVVDKPAYPASLVREMRSKLAATEHPRRRRWLS